MYRVPESCRDIFALGSIIIKSSHLHRKKDGLPTEIDYFYADANELEAIPMAKEALGDIAVPSIYFCGKINGRQVLVQERLPGAGLNVAWPYLSQDQKASFKQQAREVLRKLYSIKPKAMSTTRNHIVLDPDIISNGRITPQEAEIIFLGNNTDLGLGFMHNDFNTSNIIVNNNRIVGIIDWEMAGWFEWKTAAEVHRKVRSPQRENFANARVSEEEIDDILWWNDLYDEGPGVSVLSIE